MASILIFNIGNNRVLEWRAEVNTPDFSSRPDVIVNPVMPAGVPIKFLKVVAGAPVEMTQAEKDTITANELAAADLAKRTAAKQQIAVGNIDDLQLRAVLIYLLQEIKAAVPVYNKPNKATALSAIQAIIDNQSAD